VYTSDKVFYEILYYDKPCQHYIHVEWYNPFCDLDHTIKVCSGDMGNFSKGNLRKQNETSLFRINLVHSQKQI